MATPHDTTHNATERQRRARYLIECWTDPMQFETKEDFLAGLTEGLDELAESFGAPVPDLEKARNHWH